MEKRIQTIIIVVALVIVVSLQVIVPVYTGDVNLTIPQRIRTAFSWLLGEPEWAEPEEPALTLEPDTLYPLEEHPETGEETPLEAPGEEDLVELPPEGPEDTAPPAPVEGENQLPLDRMDIFSGGE